MAGSEMILLSMLHLSWLKREIQKYGSFVGGGGECMPLNDIQLSMLVKDRYKSCVIFLCDHLWQWCLDNSTLPFVARDCVSTAVNNTDIFIKHVGMLVYDYTACY